MTELEKIEKMYALAQSEQEKSEIANARDVITTAVHRMLNSATEVMTGKPAPKQDFSDVLAALKTLNELGGQYGIEFQKCENERDAAMYLIRFLREGLFH